MKIYKLISISLLAAIAAGCEVLPAEEPIAETGMAAFTASFETLKDVPAIWSKADRLQVIDSEGTMARFTLDNTVGDGNRAEFSGEITPKATIRKVIYAPGNDVEYDLENMEFSVTIPSTYSPKDVGVVSANNAAIGDISGTEVQLKTVGGYLRLNLVSNGEKVETGGKTYELTDIKKVVVISRDGKLMAGTVKVSWPDGDKAPKIIDVTSGTNAITFNTRTINTTDGRVVCVAGQYYLPVIVNNYENVDVIVTDDKGNETVSATGKTFNVERAAMSNGGDIEWPTITLKAEFVGTSSAFKASGINVTGFGSNNLGCDRWNISTGEMTAGTSKKRTEVSFTNKVLDPATGVVTDYKYSSWTTMGMGESTSSSKCVAFLINNYNAKWEYPSGSGTYNIVGTQAEWAWIKVPAQDGILSKLEISMSSGNSGPVTICDAVDMDGHPSGNILAEFKTTTAYQNYSITIPGAVEGVPYYIVLGEGYNYKIQNWTIYYKVYPKDE